MSLTSLTRKLVSLAINVHIRSLRSALWAYRKQSNAAIRAVTVAEQAVFQMEAAAQEARDAAAGARREELQAETRYTMEIDTLGGKL